MAKQFLIEKDGQELFVSEKAFSLIYEPKGYRFIAEQPDLELTDEINPETQQSALADAEPQGDSGQGGSAVGSGTRKSHKAKNSKRT